MGKLTRQRLGCGHRDQAGGLVFGISTAVTGRLRRNGPFGQSESGFGTGLGACIRRSRCNVTLSDS
jgi:hypothetical protein